MKENEELHEKLATLEEELVISRSMLEESRNLVELLTEIIQEQEGDANDSALPNNINANLSRPIYGSDSTTSDDAANDTVDEGAITDDSVDEKEPNTE